MRASIKTMSYIKRMISLGKWKDAIPSALTISQTMSVSGSTVRKVLRLLENQRVVENNGSIGYSIIPKKFEELYRANKQLYYLALLQRNIRITKLLDQGARIIGNFAFLGNRNDLTVANVSSGNIIRTNIRELNSLTIQPITVDSMIGLNGQALKKARDKYNKQKRVSGFRELVIRHEKELGL